MEKEKIIETLKFIGFAIAIYLIINIFFSAKITILEFIIWTGLFFLIKYIKEKTTKKREEK